MADAAMVADYLDGVGRTEEVRQLTKAKFIGMRYIQRRQLVSTQSHRYTEISPEHVQREVAKAQLGKDVFTPFYVVDIENPLIGGKPKFASAEEAVAALMAGTVEACIVCGNHSNAAEKLLPEQYPPNGLVKVFVYFALTAEEIELLAITDNDSHSENLHHESVVLVDQARKCYFRVHPSLYADAAAGEGLPALNRKEKSEPVKQMFVRTFPSLVRGTTMDNLFRNVMPDLWAFSRHAKIVEQVWSVFKGMIERGEIQPDPRFSGKLRHLNHKLGATFYQAINSLKPNKQVEELQHLIRHRDFGRMVAIADGLHQRRATLAKSAGKAAAPQAPSSISGDGARKSCLSRITPQPNAKKTAASLNLQAKAAKSASPSHVSPSETAAKTLAFGMTLRSRQKPSSEPIIPTAVPTVDDVVASDMLFEVESLKPRLIQHETVIHEPAPKKAKVETCVQAPLEEARPGADEAAAEVHKLRRDLKKALRRNARLEEWYRQEATRVPVYRQQSRLLADLLGPAREKGSVLVAMYPDPKPDARNPKNVWPPDGLPKDLIPDWPYLFKMPTDHDAKLKGSKAKETGASDNHSDQEAFYMVQSLGPFVKDQRNYVYDCTLHCVFVEKRRAFFIPTRGCKVNSEVRIEDSDLQAVTHAAAMAFHTVNDPATDDAALLDLLAGEYLTKEGQQQAREVPAIERPTTDCGPNDAKVLICADWVGCPLELKLAEIHGRTVYVSAWGGKPIADVLARSVFLRGRGVGTKVLVLLAGTNDIFQLVSSHPTKSASPSSCRDATKQLIDQYRFFLRHNRDRYDVVCFAELLPQKWKDADKQALITVLIESFNKELAMLVDEFTSITDNEKRACQVFLIPVYNEFDLDDLEPLTNGRESSVNLQYVEPHSGSSYRRNQADGDAQTQRRPRERFAAVIGEFLRRVLL